MKDNKFILTNEGNLESQSDKKRDVKLPESGSKSYVEKVRQYLGPASAGNVLKAAFVGILTMTAGIGNVKADQSRSLQSLSGSSDNPTGLLPLSNQRGQFIGYSPSERYVPSEKDLKQFNEFLEKMNNPPFYFGPKDAQEIPSEEASQSVLETHQREQDKNERSDPLASNGEKIDPLPSLMDKLKENPQSLRKMLNERAMRGRSLSEAPTASDKQSTCSDPCSDTPASVDCIKECTTTVSNNPSACLDVSASEVSAKIEPSDQVPGQQVRLDYHLSVQNNCPKTIDNVTYQVDIAGSGCPFPSTFDPAPASGYYTQIFSADPSSVAPRDSAGVKVGQNASSINRCQTWGWGYQITGYSLPSDLSATISAYGTDSTTNSQISSQQKIFTVLGPSVSEGTTPCDQKCPTATPAKDTPSHRHKGLNGDAVAGAVLGTVAGGLIIWRLALIRRAERTFGIRRETWEAWGQSICNGSQGMRAWMQNLHAGGYNYMCERCIPSMRSMRKRILELCECNRQRPVEPQSRPDDIHSRPAESPSRPFEDDSLPNLRMPSPIIRPYDRIGR